MTPARRKEGNEEILDGRIESILQKECDIF
jgi:hypothetical protein